MIYNVRAAQLLLGVLLSNPQLLFNEKYNLSKEDFQIDYHKSLFNIIQYLSKQGSKNITPVEIDNVLTDKKSIKARKILEDNDYIQSVPIFKDLADENNIDSYYNDVKRCSLLRFYQSNGFDISKFENSDDGIDDIIGYFEGILLDSKRNYIGNTVMEEYQAGKDFQETKERMKLSPLVGNSFQSQYLNAIFRGMYGFILRAGKSGSGKSILSIGDICQVTVKEYWDFNRKEFIINKSRAGASLFINTELSLRDELDPIIISWISGVPRHHITNGLYENDEENRVDYANKILNESELYIVDDPCFTTNSLVSIIKEYKHKYGICNTCFDYVSNNGFVAKEIASETKVPQREDMVLLTLTDRLKQVQRETNVGLISGVQTNGTEDSMEYPTESCLAGGKSQVRKTDGTMIMLPPTKKELELIIPILSQNPHFPQPNNVIHIIKGRANQYPRNLKIFQYIDLGSGRSRDLFCLNKYNEPINVEKMVIENK